MKLAFVVQRRMGPKLPAAPRGTVASSPSGCRGATDITVLTTCASDYVTWENAFPPWRTVEHGVPGASVSVARPRRMKVFADLSDEVFEGGASRERQEEWFRENGPETPELVEYLRAHGHEFDLVVFWTFRYYQSHSVCQSWRTERYSCRPRRTMRRSTLMCCLRFSTNRPATCS